MLKLVALITAKPEISRADFIRHYETTHAPLVQSLLPMIAEYRRSYVDSSAASGAEPLSLGFDMMTELWFEDQDALDAFWIRIRTPEVIAQIRGDEAHFLISEATQLFQVDEHRSD